MGFGNGWLAAMEPAAQKAFAAMNGLEKGAIANPDEKRMRAVEGRVGMDEVHRFGRDASGGECRKTESGVAGRGENATSGRVRPSRRRASPEIEAFPRWQSRQYSLHESSQTSPLRSHPVPFLPSAG